MRQGTGLTDTEKQESARKGSGVDLATAIGNPWRFRILYAASVEDLSPSAFIRSYGGEISNIARHFRQLAEWGFLETVERRSGGPRRGGVEHVYRAGRRAHLDTPTWFQLPLILREEMSDTALGTFLDRVSGAVEEGTFDADFERHLSWIALELNRECFNELGEWLDELLARLPGLEEKARRQMQESGETPIPTTVGLFSFRSPSEPKPKNSRAIESASD